MRKVGLVVAAALWGAPSAAFAQDKAAADAAFREGRALVEARRYDEACPKFQLSNELDPALGTLLNLADCHEKQGRTASAWAEFNEVAERARHDSQRARAEEATRRANALEKRLTRLKLVQRGQAAGVTVHVGDSDVTKLVGTPFPVDPGAHQVTVRRKAEVLWKQDATVQGAGKTITVEIPPLSEIEAARAAQDQGKDGGKDTSAEKEQSHVAGGSEKLAVNPAQDATLTSEPSTTAGLGLQRYLAIAAGGVGVAALTATVYFGVTARRKYDDSRPLCNSDNICSHDGATLVQTAQKQAMWANVFGVIGLVSIAGGTVLWLTAPDRHSDVPERRQVSVSPSLGPGGLGVLLEGVF
jgi:hypothetical protein